MIDLVDALEAFIKENFDSQIFIDRTDAKNAKLTAVATPATNVIFGVVNGHHGFIRSRGRYFDPRCPDFFERLKVEFEACYKNPQEGWSNDPRDEWTGR